MQFIGSFGFFGSSVFTHGIIGVYRIPKNMVTGLVLGNGERAYLSISVKRSYQNWLVKHLLIKTQSIVFCLKDFFYNCQQIKHHVLQELGGTDAIENTYICVSTYIHIWCSRVVPSDIVSRLPLHTFLSVPWDVTGWQLFPFGQLTSAGNASTLDKKPILVILIPAAWWLWYSWTRCDTTRFCPSWPPNNTN